MTLLLQLCHLAQKKTCSFCKITLSCFANAAFIWVQDCCKKGITINSNMIQEKK